MHVSQDNVCSNLLLLSKLEPIFNNTILHGVHLNNENIGFPGIFIPAGDAMMLQSSKEVIMLDI